MHTFKYTNTLGKIVSILPYQNLNLNNMYYNQNSVILISQTSNMANRFTCFFVRGKVAPLIRIVRRMIAKPYG
jgi:hypothetical protein